MPARTRAEHIANVREFVTLALGADPAAFDDEPELDADDDRQFELRWAS